MTNSPEASSTPTELDAQGRVVRRGAYPELTLTAVLVGYFLGSIITLSIGYASLVLGFSIEGSELAAILGWGILRGMMGRTSIVENNINQTVASAVNGASAGMMFSVPALFILASQNPEKYGQVTEFSTVLMVLACITGGILGLAFVIPLRRQMIDYNRLAYPGGIAVAAILKSPGAGMHKALVLIGAAGVSGLAQVLVLWKTGESAAVGEWFNLPTLLNITFFISLMTVGVGFLSGKGGMVFGYGGFLCYFVLAPLLAWYGSAEVKDMIDPVAAAAVRGEILSADDAKTAMDGVPTALRLGLFRPSGIGMLIGAALGGIVAAFPLIRSALRSMQQAAKRHNEGASLSDEMPIKLLYAAVGVGTIVLVLIALVSVEGMGVGRAIAMAVLGTLWIWVAGVIVSECLGRTNWSPLSGMTLIAVTILILISSGLGSTASVVSSVVVGAAICVAIAQAGDMMLDLKSGYLVGALPRKQQVAQYLGTWLGPILIIILIFVLHKAYTLGSDKLPAPQGAALASMIEGVVGGNVPSWRYVAGGGLGLMLAFSGFGGIGVMIGLGFYMPFDIVLTYTIGCLARIFLEKAKGTTWVEDVGIPIAAGLIVGEALVGVGNAMIHIF
jgi:putative OPT family oligopeptide transporter